MQDSLGFEEFFTSEPGAFGATWEPPTPRGAAWLRVIRALARSVLPGTKPRVTR